MTQPAHHGGGRPKAYMHPELGRVPSVTTVLDRFRDTGGLIAFAIREGWQAETIRDEASYVGSAAHDAIADLIIDPGADWLATLEAHALAPHLYDEAVTAVQSWRRWRAGDGAAWEFLWVELPMVSGARRVGGTPDALGVDPWTGVTALFDWKTGKRLHTENVLQGAAYVEISREAGWTVDEHRVVHIPRTGEPPNELVVAGKQLELAQRVFAKLRWCYDGVATLSKFNASQLRG